MQWTETKNVPCTFGIVHCFCGTIIPFFSAMSNSYVSVSKTFFFIRAKLLFSSCFTYGLRFCVKRSVVNEMCDISGWLSWTANVSLCIKKNWSNYQSVLAALNSLSSSCHLLSVFEDHVIGPCLSLLVFNRSTCNCSAGSH